ncbi:MAG: serine acetyltransferase [Clostridia bacterium]|nr:serine acetyltransferase [Clostridia bacterium]MBR3805677.1 serine acetyltransferase [Clostridia bacterium]
MVPSRNEVVKIIKKIQHLIFPEYFSLDEDKGKSLNKIADEVFLLLKQQLTASYFFFDEDSVVDTESVAYEILDMLPEIKAKLLKDVLALYEGDPAARSPEEIILSYPGFYAISIYRIAHEFYVRKIPYIARLMTEFAHEKTGIDIHAGATIGEYFFIDHGTGIVIGETTTIGDRVKIYQGVTLGAKSFELDEDGNPVKGIKRHPDIGNGVVIYANATILGGSTKIGDGCVIGGNVWLTRSVPAGEVVYYNAK